MARLNEALRADTPLLMDGAMGTELIELGIENSGLGLDGLCNISNPEAVRGIHDRYITAGARVLLTNTFMTHVMALLDPGPCAGDAVRAGVALARASAGRDNFILGSIGPTPPNATISIQSSWLAAFQGVDGLLLETQSDFQLLDQVLPLAKSCLPGVPVLISLTFLPDAAGRPKTAAGCGPEEVAAETASRDIAGLGVNCGRNISLADVLAILTAYRTQCQRPLLARPNAGTPEKVWDRWVYPVSPDELAAWVPQVCVAGATLVGGCCGTTPLHIAACREAMEAIARPGH